MKPSCWASPPKFMQALIACLLTTLLPCTLQAQTAYPMITHVSPGAVQRGQTSDVEVFGQMDFAGVYKVLFEGTGLSAVVVPTSTVKPKAGVPIKSVKLRVTATSEALCSVREFRLITPTSVSSVGLLVVVDEPISREHEPNNAIGQAQTFNFPSAICGTIDRAEDTDYFRFHGSEGVPITFQVFCARLEDKIHDLQKHADPLLTIFDGWGKELARNDDYFFADSYLVFVPPKDADYFVQIRDAKYDGDPRWTYVVLAHNRPKVAAVFPRVGKPGESLSVEVVGSGAKLHGPAIVALPNEHGQHELPIPMTGGGSTFSFLVSDLPQLREQEPNDKLEEAQRLTLPCGVSGRINKPRDVDCFAFQGVKNKPVTFEVRARRFGTSWCSPLDSYLDVVDAKGKVLATNDDAIGKDSRLTYTPPMDGNFCLRIRDLNHRGGDAFVYYLEATRAEPDFRITFDPDKLAVGPRGNGVCFVRIERINGFTGPVEVKMDGLPPGLSASTLTIGPTMTQGVLVLHAVESAVPDASVFRVFGKATLLGGTEITRQATAREEIYLPGGGRGLFQVSTPVAAVTISPDIAAVQVEPEEVVLSPGQEVRLTVKIRRRPDFDKSVTLDVLSRHLNTVFGNPLPPGVTLVENKSKTLVGAGTEGVIVLKAAPDAKPIERVPICVLANVSINFMVKMNYSSPVIWLSVRKQP
ncbi:hypothetical protein BH10PLA2_BH10PLA2_21610 [soil metagenome]